MTVCYAETDPTVVYPEYPFEWHDDNGSGWATGGVVTEQEATPVYYVRPEHWPACDSKNECDFSSFYFNEVACQCFYTAGPECDMLCPSGSVDSPYAACGCMEQEEYDALWPDWANDFDKEYAKLYGVQEAAYAYQN